MALMNRKTALKILGAVCLGFYLVGILATDCCEVGSYDGPGEPAYYDQ